MTFLQIQNALISSVAARFKESQRDDIKNWINDRYAEIWGLENWTFRHATAPINVVANNAEVTEPSDIGIVNGLWNQYGDKLNYLSPDDYYTSHIANTYGGRTAVPDSYTVVNKQVKLDPTPSEAGAYTILYQKAVTPLSADGDIPALPTEHHYILVHGAMATGSVMMNDFTYQFAEQRWANMLESMKQNYLVDQRGETLQWGSG